MSQKLYGIKAKLHHAKRHAEKVQLKKTLKAHDERNVKSKDDGAVQEGALPTYLLDRENQRDAKALSTSIKERRKDKAAKYSVPLPKVRGISEEEMFKVLKTGSKKQKAWKRMVNKATFVGEGFTRKPVKMERFIRPMAMRYKKANVTHPDLKATFQLQIIGVKKNPQSPLYTQLGVLTKGTVIEVNVAELGMVTTGGKVVWASKCGPTISLPYLFLIRCYVPQSTLKSRITRRMTVASTRFYVSHHLLPGGDMY